MAFWTPDNLCDVTRGRWLDTEPGTSAGAACATVTHVAASTQALSGLSTDTRAIAAGQVFLALRGENHDAHNFLQKAADAGAALLIVDQPEKAAALRQPAPPVLVVRDTLAALHDLARAYRQHLRTRGVKVIAVGGSNGKTTTRQLIHTVLSSHFRGTQSPKSFNNHIGVPLTLLAAPDTDDFVVVEVGTNHPGEVDTLGRIVTPDIAFITSIGHEHMEFFRTLEGVAAEEAALLSHLAARGLALVNTQAWPYVQPFVKLPPDIKLVQYGNVQPLPASVPGIQRFTAAGLTIDMPLLGAHNAVNAAGAIAVAQSLGVPSDRIIAALAQATGVPGRLQISHLPAHAAPEQTLTLINDAYNANPDSMLAALQTLRNYPLPTPTSRRILIMGDMRELGDQAPQLHRKVGEAIATSATTAGDIHHAIFIGPLSMFAAETVSRAWPPSRLQSFAKWDDALPAQIAATLKPGDVVLIKASRGMALERLLPAITAAFAASRPGTRTSASGGSA